MCLPERDSPLPVNFLRRECLDARHISGKLPIMAISVKNILKVFTVRDVIVCGKASMGGIPREMQGSRIGGTCI